MNRALSVSYEFFFNGIEKKELSFNLILCIVTESMETATYICQKYDKEKNLLLNIFKLDGLLFYNDIGSSSYTSQNRKLSVKHASLQENQYFSPARALSPFLLEEEKKKWVQGDNFRPENARQEQPRAGWDGVL